VRQPVGANSPEEECFQANCVTADGRIAHRNAAMNDIASSGVRTDSFKPGT
jgi:hypothetical protein